MANVKNGHRLVLALPIFPLAVFRSASYLTNILTNVNSKILYVINKLTLNLLGSIHKQNMPSMF